MLLICAWLVNVASVGDALFTITAWYHVYHDRENLPVRRHPTNYP